MEFVVFINTDIVPIGVTGQGTRSTCTQLTKERVSSSFMDELLDL